MYITYCIHSWQAAASVQKLQNEDVIYDSMESRSLQAGLHSWHNTAGTTQHHTYMARPRRDNGKDNARDSLIPTGIIININKYRQHFYMDWYPQALFTGFQACCRHFFFVANITLFSFKGPCL